MSTRIVKDNMKGVDLTETEVASETVFQGKLLRVKCDAVSLHDGKAATREYVEHNGAVMIIPVLDSEIGRAHV